MDEEDVHVDCLMLPNGEEVQIPYINISKKYFIPEDFFDDIDPHSQEYEEATGNEGASVDKMYKWAAVLLWPKHMHVANISVDNAVHELYSRELLYCITN